MLLIRNGHIKPIIGQELLRGDLLIGDDGRIAAMGPELEIPQGAEMIEAEGRLVTPGCVEAHCHIGLDNEGRTGL